MKHFATDLCFRCLDRNEARREVREEFVKMVTELQNSDRFDECGDYWQALEDIKSKLLSSSESEIK
jgi:hypothetical protein